MFRVSSDPKPHTNPQLPGLTAQADVAKLKTSIKNTYQQRDKISEDLQKARLFGSGLFGFSEFSLKPLTPTRGSGLEGFRV